MWHQWFNHNFMKLREFLCEFSGRMRMLLINCVIILRSTCYCMMVIYFCPHCPTSQIFEMDTLLDHAQELAMTLVEWALTPMGHCKPKEEFIRVIASTNHLEILCLIRGLPLARLPKPTKSCSDLLYEAECSIYTLRALTGQSRDNSWPPVKGECAESAMTWALNGVESTLGT